MAHYATKDDLDKLYNSIDKKIDKAVDDLSEIFKTFAQSVNERFDRLESRVDKLESQFERLNDTR
ncbi:MAG TPA: hypothetical protein VFN56_04890 [Candidatus Saccharimonadales bacterium]|nr:hypothetical protein [Candidatus Saccharimonadales bacterium]